MSAQLILDLTKLLINYQIKYICFYENSYYGTEYTNWVFNYNSSLKKLNQFLIIKYISV